MDNIIEYFNQRFELITIYSEFKKDINEFRKKWNIDVLACEKYENDKIAISSNYIKRSVKKSPYLAEYKIVSEYGESDDFKDKIKEVRKNNKTILKNGGHPSLCKRDPVPGTIFYWAVVELLNKFNLNVFYIDVLKYYIFRDKIISVPSVIVGKKNDSKVLELHLADEVMKEGGSVSWSSISKWSMAEDSIRRIERYRTLGNYEFHKRIWELYNSDLTKVEKTKTINNEYVIITKMSKNCPVNRFEKHFTDPELLSSTMKELIGYSIIDQYARRVKKFLELERD